MLLIDKTRIFDHLLVQHSQEAAYLWSQRAYAVAQLHQSREFLIKLEHRIHRHLQGLLLSPNYSWEPALEAAQTGDSGELFVLAFLAFQNAQRSDSKKIEQVFNLARENPSTLPGLLSAMGWTRNDFIYPFLRPWLESEDEFLRYLSLCTCSLKRLDPRDYLNFVLRDEADPVDRVIARALRLAGELKRYDVLPEVRRFAEANHYWAQWSCLLLGDRSNLHAFEEWALQPGPQHTNALQLAVHCQAASPTPTPFFTRLARAEEQKPSLIMALAALGDPAYVEWLIGVMVDSRLAPLAGYAFSTIVGVDLYESDLTLPVSPDEETEFLSGCENLPCPDPQLVAQYWSRHKHRFTVGQPYLWGQLKTPAWRESIVKNGWQGHRQAAALELALMDAKRVLANVKQPEVV